MNNRTCIVSRMEYNVEEMLRFVVAPHGKITPDLKRVLPGRGAYIFAKKSFIKQAVTNNLLIRHFKTRQLKCKAPHSTAGIAADITIESDIDERIEQLLLQQALASLALGRKAGAVTSGSLACDKAIRSNQVALIIHRIDAAKDGINKISQAIHASKLGQEIEIKQISIFTPDQLTAAFGDRNAVHIAILNKPAAKNILTNIDKLHIYRE